MKTAKQFLQNKYPEMRGENWNITNIDDNWVAEQMELFANEKANAILQEAEERVEELRKSYLYNSGLEQDVVGRRRMEIKAEACIFAIKRIKSLQIKE